VSWARPCERDTTLPAQAGEPELCPPDPGDALALCVAHLALPGAPLPIRARLDYGRWKPRVSITCGYTLSYADGEERIVSLKRYAAGKGQTLARSFRPDERAQRAEDRLSSFAALPQLDTCLYAFPADRVLPGAARIVHLRRTARLLNALPLDPDRRVRARHSSARLLRYKPEHRAVLGLDLALEDANGGQIRVTLAARALPPPEAAIVSRARSLCFGSAPGSTQPIGPRLLHVEERTGIVLEEWIDGEGHRGTTFEHAHGTGALLARLHALPQPADSLPACGAAEAVSPLFELDPRLISAAGDLIGPPPPTRLAWIHGDLHPDQVVRECNGGALRLLDLDALGPGDPARDLATWIADHLGTDPAIGLADAARPILEGYRLGGGRAPEERDLAHRVAFELTMLSAGALRRLERGAVGRALFLLERASDLRPTRRARA
jgi:Phosphotransferase enzyme family